MTYDTVRRHCYVSLLYCFVSGMAYCALFYYALFCIATLLNVLCVPMDESMNGVYEWTMDTSSVFLLKGLSFGRSLELPNVIP